MIQPFFIEKEWFIYGGIKFALLPSRSPASSASLELQVFESATKKSVVCPQHIPSEHSSNCHPISGQPNSYYSENQKDDDQDYAYVKITTGDQLQYPNNLNPVYKQHLAGCPLIPLLTYSRFSSNTDQEIINTVKSPSSSKAINLFGGDLPAAVSCEPWIQNEQSGNNTYATKYTSVEDYSNKSLTDGPKSHLWLYIGLALAFVLIAILITAVALCVYYKRQQRQKSSSDPQDLSNLHSIDDFTWKNVSNALWMFRITLLTAGLYWLAGSIHNVRSEQA